MILGSCSKMVEVLIGRHQFEGLALGQLLVFPCLKEPALHLVQTFRVLVRWFVNEFEGNLREGERNVSNELSGEYYKERRRKIPSSEEFKSL